MSKVKEIWDHGADVYDEIYAGNIPYHRSHPVVVDLLRKDHPMEILDLGAGTGLLASIILQRLPRSRVTCLDFSPNMLAKAHQRLHSFGARVSLICADMRTWEAPNRYDAIVTCNALVYREMNLLDCYRRYAACLQAEGMLINSTVVLQNDLQHLMAVMGHFSEPGTKQPSATVKQFADTYARSISHFGDGSLAMAETVEKHTDLMSEAGLTACCPWHYMAQAVIAGRKEKMHANR